MGMFSIFYSMTQDVSGPQTSRVLGVLGAIIWLAISFIHPRIGAWVDITGDFKPAFVLFGFIPMIGFIASLFWQPQHTENVEMESARV